MRGMSMREMAANKLDPTRRGRWGGNNPDPGEGPVLVGVDVSFDDGVILVDQGDGMHVADGRFQLEADCSLPDREPPGWCEVW